jgi:hypothetical protein
MGFILLDDKPLASFGAQLIYFSWLFFGLPGERMFGGWLDRPVA